jgi:hypothetical protein
MSTDEFQQLWKAYDARLEKSLRLNQQLLETIRTQKIRTAFNWQILFKIMMIVGGVAWNIICGSLLWRFRDEPVFVASAALVILFTSLSIAGYVMQLLLLLQMNLSKSILDTQRQLAQLEVLIARTLRVSFLQAPIYTVCFITKQEIAAAGPWFWIIHGLVTALFIAASVWLYRKVSVKNTGIRWVKRMIDNEGGKTVSRARGFIREIEAYREGDKHEAERLTPDK